MVEDTVGSEKHNEKGVPIRPYSIAVLAAQETRGNKKHLITPSWANHQNNTAIRVKMPTFTCTGLVVLMP